MSFFEDFDKMWKRLRKFFEEMEREMFEDFERMFKEFEKRPFMGPGKPRYYYYGFEISIGPDGKPRVREFGNIRPREGTKPIIQEEVEPLTDVIEEEDKIKVVMDLPGVNKEDIRIRVSEDGKKVIVSATDDRKYYKEIDLPAIVDPSKSKATYRNGVLTIELEKKEKKKGGFEIKIE